MRPAKISKKEIKNFVHDQLKLEAGFLDEHHKKLDKAKEQENQNEPLNPKFEEAKRYANLEAVGYSITKGSGEYFISPFIIKLGATNFQIGLLSSMSSLFSSISQLITADITDKLQSRKKIVLWSMLFQALIWIPLVFNALFFKSVFLTIFLFSLYTFSASMLSAPYLSWLGDIVSRSSTGHYFGVRIKILRLGAFITTMVAGFLLNRFQSVNTLLGFAILFFISFAARMFSYHFVKKMYEPPVLTKKEHYFSFIQFVKKMKYSNFGVFVIYIFLLQMAVSIASPYFTPFMLKYLNFNYKTFVLVDMSMTVAMFLTLEAWGKLSDRIGNKRIMMFNSFIISMYPLMWLFSSNPFYLGTVNFISGIAWAGFALSSSNYVYDAVTVEKRTRCIAYSNFFKGIAVVIGAMAGAFLGSKVGIVSSLIHINVNKYKLMFFVSFVFRFAVTIYFLKKVRDFSSHRNSTIAAAKFFMSSLTQGAIPTVLFAKIKEKRKKRKIKRA